MCVCFLLFDLHPQILLLLAFNRDEYYARPTHPAHFWPDHPSLLAGRDVVGNGTWLGVTRSGRFACVTNHREAVPPDHPHLSTSRGSLPTDFLNGSMSPLDYVQSLVPRLQQYSGFNLVVGDAAARQLAYVSNRDPGGPRLLPPGLYGVSNGLLMQWPKVQRGLQELKGILQAGGVGEATAEAADPCGATSAPEDPPAGRGPPAADAQQPPPTGSAAAAAAAAAASGVGGGAVPWEALFTRLLGDTQPAAEEELPLTGVGRELDRLLSPIFVEQLPLAEYGTRSQTVVAVSRDGRAELHEVLRDHEDGGKWRHQAHSFDLEPAAVDAAAAAGGDGGGEARTAAAATDSAPPSLAAGSIARQEL